MDRMMAKWGGGEVLRKAVSGMLPKNRLRKERLARLKTFEGTAHPYGQNLLKVGNGGGQVVRSRRRPLGPVGDRCFFPQAFSH